MLIKRARVFREVASCLAMTGVVIDIMTDKILFLTLKKAAFDVMVSGEKVHEYRRNSTWIRSRLIGKGYAFVMFRNGYGADKPFFIAKFLNYQRLTEALHREYSNGLVVDAEAGTFCIKIGDIIATGNLKK